MLIRRRCGAVRTLRSLRSLRVLMAAATSSVFLRRERVVEEREASAAAVAKAVFQPSEFHHAVNMKNQQSSIVNIDINAVKSRMLQVRGQQVLLDRDVAALYGVETRVVNQAVKNNPDKFPAGYVVELTQDEIKVLRSKILTLETTPGKESVR